MEMWGSVAIARYLFEERSLQLSDYAAFPVPSDQLESHTHDVLRWTVCRWVRKVTYTRVHTTCPLRAEAMGTQLPVYTASHYSTPEDLP